MPSAYVQLDSRLRAVSLPSGLLERLMTIPYEKDVGLDEAVRDLELPVGLMQSLVAIPLVDDEGLDEALRDVPVSRKLEVTLRRRTHRVGVRRKERSMDRTLRISRIAAASSLVVAVSLGLGSALVLSRLIGRASESPAVPTVAEKTGETVPNPKEQSLETSLEYPVNESTVNGFRISEDVFPPKDTSTIAHLFDCADGGGRPCTGPQARTGDVEYDPLRIGEDRQAMLRTAREVEDDPRVIGPGPEPDGVHLHPLTRGSLSRGGVSSDADDRARPPVQARTTSWDSGASQHNDTHLFSASR